MLYASTFQTEAAALMTHGEVPVTGAETMFSDGRCKSVVTKGNDMIGPVTEGENRHYITNAYEVLKGRDHVEIELQETFFAKGYAMLTDPFGIKWQLSCPNA